MSWNELANKLGKVRRRRDKMRVLASLSQISLHVLGTEDMCLTTRQKEAQKPRSGLSEAITATNKRFHHNVLKLTPSQDLTVSSP